MEKNCLGHVCFIHFEHKCFKKLNNGKVSKKTELEANSVPTIFEEPVAEVAEVAELTEVCNNMSNNFLDADDLIVPLSALAFATPEKKNRSSSTLIVKPEILMLTPPSIVTTSTPTSSSTVATVETSNVQGCSHCVECVKKDKLIDIRDAQIRELRKTLNKVQKKVWYLETVRKKLDATLSEMKKQSLLDEELSRTLEVCHLY